VVFGKNYLKKIDCRMEIRNKEADGSEDKLSLVGDNLL
jgi:hypothetical protein